MRFRLPRGVVAGELAAASSCPLPAAAAAAVVGDVIAVGDAAGGAGSAATAVVPVFLFLLGVTIAAVPASEHAPALDGSCGPGPWCPLRSHPWSLVPVRQASHDMGFNPWPEPGAPSPLVFACLCFFFRWFGVGFFLSCFTLRALPGVAAAGGDSAAAVAVAAFLFLVGVAMIPTAVPAPVPVPAATTVAAAAAAAAAAPAPIPVPAPALGPVPAAAAGAAAPANAAVAAAAVIGSSRSN